MSTYFDFGARLFSMQWPPYGAHILQGLLKNEVSAHVLVLLVQHSWRVAPPCLKQVKIYKFENRENTPLKSNYWKEEEKRKNKYNYDKGNISFYNYNHLLLLTSTFT